jgi:hypothetical protein
MVVEVGYHPWGVIMAFCLHTHVVWEIKMHICILKTPKEGEGRMWGKGVGG